MERLNYWWRIRFLVTFELEYQYNNNSNTNFSKGMALQSSVIIKPGQEIEVATSGDKIYKVKVSHVEDLEGKIKTFSVRRNNRNPIKSFHSGIGCHNPAEYKRKYFTQGSFGFFVIISTLI